MKHVMMLLIKFGISTVAFAIGLDLFFDATIVDILSFSVFVTIVTYVFVDREILPRLGNTVASMTDFLLVYLSVWVFGSYLFEGYLQVAWGSGISAVIITMAEVFVHRYLLGGIAERVNRERSMSFNRRFAYEFAEENEIHNPKKEE
ncbi:YndM family protein [Ectobacillus antri]|jgi:hypothetical protein|uniref:YndM family protein n=1 Tax=Ectobacillus antri TaxID=2486280 RepID=A0ABT6H5H2_9BACI|nr:YndM family protein [Ectobacillus antri]MDG4657132.1 YndM family protein [Ectobacillus antri]MDG5754591.1 YndM family protein [Ectobacillus antri]